MIIKHKTKEVDIVVNYREPIGGPVKLNIEASGDFSHHLIEELFGVIDKLARMERVGHCSQEWRSK